MVCSAMIGVKNENKQTLIETKYMVQGGGVQTARVKQTVAGDRIVVDDSQTSTGKRRGADRTVQIDSSVSVNRRYRDVDEKQRKTGIDSDRDQINVKH